eukprot:INCI8264.2.p1 GENE.INCI8264.2~~INCI8264.2.p1  ORF type:complete len:488 (-),score=77.05 INCI8264.2:344-1807(-)
MASRRARVGSEPRPPRNESQEQEEALESQLKRVDCTAFDLTVPSSSNLSVEELVALRREERRSRSRSRSTSHSRSASDDSQTVSLALLALQSDEQTSSPPHSRSLSDDNAIHQVNRIAGGEDNVTSSLNEIRSFLRREIDQMGEEREAALPPRVRLKGQRGAMTTLAAESGKQEPAPRDVKRPDPTTLPKEAARSTSKVESNEMNNSAASQVESSVENSKKNEPSLSRKSGASASALHGQLEKNRKKGPIPKNLDDVAKVAAQVFHDHDLDENGAMNRLEFKAVLKKIQPEAMQHLDHSEFHREARRMFDEADTNGSRRLCVKEFVRFYLDTMAREHERQRDLQEEQLAAHQKGQEARKQVSQRNQWSEQECSVAVSISQGDLDGLKQHMHQMSDLQTPMVLGGIPPIVLAAHCGQIGIVEWLTSLSSVRASMSSIAVAALQRACRGNHLDAVQKIVNEEFDQVPKRQKCLPTTPACRNVPPPQHTL